LRCMKWFLKVNHNYFKKVREFKVRFTKNPALKLRFTKNPAPRWRSDNPTVALAAAA